MSNTNSTNNSLSPRNLLGDKRHTDWFHLDNAIIDTVAQEVGVYGLAVYVALCRFAGNSETAFPSYQKLAETLGISRSQVKREIVKLAEAELITKEPRYSDAGEATSNLYYLQSPGSRVAHTEPGGVSENPPGVSENRGVGSVRTPKNTELEEETDKNTSIEDAPSGAETGVITTLGGGEAMPFNKWLTDIFYEGVKKEHNVTLEPGRFSFHLGRFKTMVEKYNPEVAEAERVVEHMVRVFPQFPNIDAMKGMEDVKTGRDTGEAWEGPAPWEKAKQDKEVVNPHSDKGEALRDKPRKDNWYKSTFPVLSWERIDQLLATYDSHAEIMEEITK